MNVTYITSKNESRNKTAVGEVEAEEKDKHQNNCNNNSIVSSVTRSVYPCSGYCTHLMVGLNQHNIASLLCESIINKHCEYMLCMSNCIQKCYV